MRRAYTLVELLLVVSIIALLLSLLLPVIANARSAGRAAACLSNLHQIGAAFTLYDNDHHTFPFSEEWNGRKYAHRYAYGGVYWDHGNDVPLDFTTKDRPLNPYVGRERFNQADDAVWYCPNDDGVETPGAAEYGFDDDPWWSLAGDWYGDVYHFTGNSYRSNSSLWLKSISDPYMEFGQYGFKDIHVSHSMFVLTGDACGMTLAPSGIPNSVMIQGDWHGLYKCQMAFADGSAGIRDIISPRDSNGHIRPTTHNGYTCRRGY